MKMPVQKPPMDIDILLGCSTPMSWVKTAQAQQDVLIIDHANCEKKAAATAFNLMFRYGERLPELQEALSKLVREELKHFEQVTRLMHRRHIAYRPLAPARYAEGLRRHLRKREPERFTDLLVIGAFIEARSCERFRALTRALDEELSAFYHALETAEARHFGLYLGMAEKYGCGDVEERIGVLREVEAELIRTEDDLFRFHSGVPA